MICCFFPDGPSIRHQGESEHRFAAQPDHRLWLHTGGKISPWSYNPLHERAQRESANDLKSTKQKIKDQSVDCYTSMSWLFLCLSADGGHAERLPERPVLHQQWDPDTAAAVGQHECEAEEQAGSAQPPQSAGGRAGGARRHDLVSVMESKETVKCYVGLFVWCLTASLQHHPGQSGDGAGVSGAAPRTQQQDQLRQRAELQRDAGLLWHPGHRWPPQTQGDTRQNNHGTCSLSCFSPMWKCLNVCVSRQAVSKIREFILQKIYSFRKPMTNYQIPQNTLLKYRWVHRTCWPSVVSAPPLYLTYILGILLGRKTKMRTMIARSFISSWTVYDETQKWSLI